MWAPTPKDISKLMTIQNKIERATMGIKLKDKVKLKVIINKMTYNQDSSQYKKSKVVPGESCC